MASELTPEAIAELRRLNEERLKFRDWPSARSASTSAEWMNAAAEKFPALLDAAERCAAAEAQAKAAGELLRAAQVAGKKAVPCEAIDRLHDAIDAAERAGVKP